MDEIIEEQAQESQPVLYRPLSAKLALQLAAPHTWPAAIMPCLAAVCAAGVAARSLSITMSLALLLICILFQAAANTFNDYFDFKKGTDSADDNVEESDNTLVFNRLNPKTVLILGIAFIVLAFALGVYIVLKSGFVPLIIAVVGAAVVVLYSAGKTPLSYLPVGEIVSGIFFGMLIPVAVYISLNRSFDWRILLWCLPFVIGVGLIMMTNNTCDIEKDTTAERKTLPVLWGRPLTVEVYHLLIAVWIVLIIVFSALFFISGFIIIPFMVLACWPVVKPLVSNPLLPETRIKAMGQILSVNVILGAFYVAVICCSGYFVLAI